MKKLFYYVIGIVILISCTNRHAEIQVDKIDFKKVTKDSLALQKLHSYLNSKIAEPFEVSEIDNLNFTSGVGQEIANHKKCDSSGMGFYGNYYLIDEDLLEKVQTPVGGIITIHSDNKTSGWKSTDTDQVIWKINLKSDVISVWDSIKIGMTRTEIEKFGKANKGFCVKKGDIFFSCDFHNFLVVYLFKGDTLKELTIERKCENEIKN